MRDLALQPGRVASAGVISQMSSSFSYVQALRIARDSAVALGFVADARRFNDVYTNVTMIFGERYWDASHNTYGNGQQAALVYALYLGSVPVAREEAMLEQLIELIQNATAQPSGEFHFPANKTHQCDQTPCLDTGILSTKWMMELLSIKGRTDVGLDLVLTTAFPSWGFMAAMNSTTIWEHWELMNGEGMNSHNHAAFASIGAWFFRWVVGVRLDDGADGSVVPNEHYGTGFKRVLFSPGCVTDARLPSVAARIHTSFGPVEMAWIKSASEIVISLSLPANTCGRVVIPAIAQPASTRVTVSDVSLGKSAPGLVVWSAGKFAPAAVKGVLNGSIVGPSIEFEIRSGRYHFCALISEAPE